MDLDCFQNADNSKNQKTSIRGKVETGVTKCVQGQIDVQGLARQACIPCLQEGGQSLQNSKLCLATVSSRPARAMRSHLKTTATQKQNKKMFGFGGHIVSFPVCSFLKILFPEHFNGAINRQLARFVSGLWFPGLQSGLLGRILRSHQAESIFTELY